MRGQTKDFFRGLLALCREHNVNIGLDGTITFFLDENDHHNVIEFHDIDITGAWDIRVDSPAVIATRTMQPAITEELEIAGLGKKKKEDEEDEVGFE